MSGTLVVVSAVAVSLCVSGSTCQYQYGQSHKNLFHNRIVLLLYLCFLSPKLVLSANPWMGISLNDCGDFYIVGGKRHKNVLYAKDSILYHYLCRMFIVILFIFLGIAAGYVLRKRFSGACDTVQTLQGRLITYLIWLLLFLLGVEVGGNEQIIRALPTLGVEALLISVATVVGCCSLAWGLWKMTGGKR